MLRARRAECLGFRIVSAARRGERSVAQGAARLYEVSQLRKRLFTGAEGFVRAPLDDAEHYRQY